MCWPSWPLRLADVLAELAAAVAVLADVLAELADMLTVLADVLHVLTELTVLCLQKEERKLGQ